MLDTLMPGMTRILASRYYSKALGKVCMFIDHTDSNHEECSQSKAGINKEG